ncbi:hypothetical protein BJF95_04805 [Rhizobium oryziradicis]|uniref:Uncharacterized protein n=1 Tax=Rhizobium oryziradicis TaxID=1867956 RepID=A0A1Q8ZSK7_9HYPH|nr:hypothetical protein BJF95_04805 [Rhizobium oryziradicis]
MLLAFNCHDKAKNAKGTLYHLGRAGLREAATMRIGVLHHLGSLAGDPKLSRTDRSKMAYRVAAW